MIRITGLKLHLGEPETLLETKIKKRLRLDKSTSLDYVIYKKSLDARKKEDIYYNYTVDVKCKEEKKIIAKASGRDISLAPDMEYRFPQGEVQKGMRPVVVGFGPGGMFAGLLLAQMGLCPVIVERGEKVEQRTATVDEFWKNGILNVESNVQFGEGGAGTFSDGKLTTQIKDLRCRKVLEEMVKAGAPKEIMYESKAHIGTDKLKDVVKNIRETICSLGGEVRFNSKMTDILYCDGEVTGIVVNRTEEIKTNHLILSIGHSARDTFTMLYEKGIAMEQKPFAVGVRMEHLQQTINKAQYGTQWDNLPPADYKLTYHAANGRSVYTFCMCPGGYVVAAASEKNRLVVNGMSEYSRNGENANSALLVQVFPEDFEGTHPLAGVEFQRKLEEKAFIEGGGNYRAPVQTVGSFLSGEEKEQEVKPTYRPGTVQGKIEKILPDYMVSALKEAIPAMGKKLKCFDSPDAVLTAVESRSSSPVRMIRSETGESITLKGLYPVGEGAGYAGGIISAAVDGVIAAEGIFHSRCKNEK